MHRVDILIAGVGVGVSKYGDMGLRRANFAQKKTESNQRTSPLYIIPDITLQPSTLPELSYHSMQDCLHAFVNPGRSFIH